MKLLNDNGDGNDDGNDNDNNTSKDLENASDPKKYVPIQRASTNI